MVIATPAQALNHIFRGYLHPAQSGVARHYPQCAISLVETADYYIQPTQRGQLVGLSTKLSDAHRILDDTLPGHAPYLSDQSAMEIINNFAKVRNEYFNFLLREAYTDTMFGSALTYVGANVDTLLRPRSLEPFDPMGDRQAFEQRLELFTRDLQEGVPTADCPKTAFVRNPHTKEPSPVQVPERFEPWLSSFWEGAWRVAVNRSLKAYGIYLVASAAGKVHQEEFDRLRQNFRKIRYVPPKNERKAISELVRFFAQPPEGIALYLDQEHLERLVMQTRVEGCNIFISSGEISSWQSTGN